MTEPKLKLFVWTCFCPSYTAGLAFALAYTKAEAKAAVVKAYGHEPREWGRCRVHRVEAGRAEAIAGGG